MVTGAIITIFLIAYRFTSLAVCTWAAQQGDAFDSIRFDQMMNACRPSTGVRAAIAALNKLGGGAASSPQLTDPDGGKEE